ncbi:hypothetical protein HDV05_007692 [Chytridiales sp. JEL 0842]|nr:hypothetical protein HDV05_007692 [Chytridiales sp. JEL 0842]
MQGNCRYDASCLFAHTTPTIAKLDPTVPDFKPQGIEECLASAAEFEVVQIDNLGQNVELEEKEVCGICLESPKVFGLLLGCKHPFCMECVMAWRDRSTKADTELASSDVLKTCPTCRSPSPFVVPSNRFPTVEGEKEAIVERYKLKMRGRPCKYFGRSTGSDRRCPFGKYWESKDGPVHGDDCLYNHDDENGVRVTNVRRPSPPRRHRRNRRRDYEIDHIHAMLSSGRQEPNLQRLLQHLARHLGVAQSSLRLQQVGLEDYEFDDDEEFDEDEDEFGDEDDEDEEDEYGWEDEEEY